MIYWSEFSWDAFATLAAGLAAVFAALILGMRQAKILEKQISSQELVSNRDLELREIELKCTLLDRRISCIGTIREVRRAYVQGGLDNFEDHAKLFDAVKLAEFIFPESAIEPIRNLSDTIFKAETANRRVASADRRGDEEGRQKALDLLIEIEEKIWDALPNLEAHLVEAAKVEI